MPDPRALLATHIARLKKIGAKLKAAKDLSTDDLDFLAGHAPRTTQQAGALQASYDSMANLAGALRVPLKLIKAAKKAGAPGFDGSRVYTGEFLPWLVHWLYSTSGFAKAELRQDRVDEERYLKIKEERERKAGQYLPKAQTLQELETLGQRQKAALRTALEDDLPPIIQHKDAAAIRTHMKELVDRLCRMMSEIKL